MFDEYKKLFDNNKLYDLLSKEKSVLWLKLRAITRKDLLEKFIRSNNILIQSKKINDIFKELYYKLEDDSLLDSFIRNNINVLDKVQEQKLVSELHMIKHFDWGGDYKNALDRFIVDKYIKKYNTYEEIVAKLDNEISVAVSGYVKCSWYNHWSSILIENIIKNHSSILPAIGEIRHIDFFIQNIPFDLKTTYLPTNFVDKERKEKGLLTEVNEYKKIAKDYNIMYNVKNIIYEVREKGLNINIKDCIERIKNIDAFRRNLVSDCIVNPYKLIQNLYEEQGEMRFDASNRLFLILVDTDNFENSWKLKRDVNLLKSNIYSYLDNFDKAKILANPITFKYKFKEDEIFKVYSDCIFISK